MIDLPAFYSDLGKYLLARCGSDRNYNRHYGERRTRDAYYALHIAGFEIIPVGTRTSILTGHDAPLTYTHIYNRKGEKPDLQHLIAPDTRLPNYTTSLDDCMELATTIGLTQLRIPENRYNVAGQFIEQILHACDAVIETGGMR